MNALAKQPISRFLSENQIKSKKLENHSVIYSLYATHKSKYLTIIDEEGNDTGLVVVEQKNRNIVKAFF